MHEVPTNPDLGNPSEICLPGNDDGDIFRVKSKPKDTSHATQTHEQQLLVHRSALGTARRIANDYKE